MIVLNDSVRKNILIDAEADKRVQNNRAKFLAKDTPVDIDYSTMSSMLIELGDVVMELMQLASEDGEIVLLAGNVDRAKGIIAKYTR